MMHRTLSLTAAAVLGLSLLTPATAATVFLSNVNPTFDGNDLLFLDRAGNPYSQGFVALSTTPDLSGLLPASLVTMNPGNYLPSGIFSSSLSTANDGSLNGVNLYLLVGDHPDPALTAQMFVIDLENSFDKADTPPPPASFDVNLTRDANILVGSVFPVTVDASAIGGPSSYNTFALMIPEPAGGLLAGLAGAMLLLRRKRAS